MNPHAAAFACNTYSYMLSRTACDTINHLAEQGFSEVELMMYPGHLWPPEATTASRKALRQQAEALGMRIGTLNMPNVDMNIAGASPEMRRYTLKLLEGIVDLAGDLGVPGIVIGPGKANPLFPAPREQLTGYFFAALDALLPRAQKAGTALWVENMPFAFLPGISELMDALDRYGDDTIGIVFDVANSHFVAENIGAALERCRARLKLVHLSDTGQQVYKHDPVGHGTVPFAEIPDALAAVGYNRSAMLEIISHDPDREIRLSTERLNEFGFIRI
jgi:sugar phosphate isomerase/epimerase